MPHAASNKSPEQAQAARHRGVLAYFQQRQAEDPLFLEHMLDSSDVDASWDELPEAERETVALIAQHLYPDDLGQRQRITRGLLLMRDLLQEFDLTDELVAQVNQSGASPTS